MSPDVVDVLPDEAWAVALLSLPGMGPARFHALCSDASPAAVWSRLLSNETVADRSGRITRAQVERWRTTARTMSVEALWRRLVGAGIGVCRRGGPAYPEALVADPEPPAVLFHRGSPEVLAGARVAIVGTRRCSRYGRDVAHELGRRLAESGVGVVSGLALGIDAAAHRGALDAASAPPVAVVGSGLDVVYPASNRGLWQEVASAGVVFSEAPPGSRPERWRFPARNRLIAALADVVVVVESHDHGGSMHTVAEAAARDRPVLAVPGPIRSPSSRGTNRLLSEGCAPVCSVDDVLVALGMTPGVSRLSSDHRQLPDAAQQTVLDAIAWQPTSLDQLADRVEASLSELVETLDCLVELGWVERRGVWFERAVAP